MNSPPSPFSGRAARRESFPLLEMSSLFLGKESIDFRPAQRSTVALASKTTLPGVERDRKKQMPPKSIEQEIQARVSAFTSELAALIRTSVLESLHQSLGLGSAPRATTASPAATGAPLGGRRGTRGRRGAGASGVAAAQVLDYVKSNPGSRLEQIAKGLNKPSASLKPAIAAMLASGTLTKAGERRGTKYSVGSGTLPAEGDDSGMRAVRRKKRGGNRRRSAKSFTKKKST